MHSHFSNCIRKLRTQFSVLFLNFHHCSPNCKHWIYCVTPTGAYAVHTTSWDRRRVACLVVSPQLVQVITSKRLLRSNEDFFVLIPNTLCGNVMAAVRMDGLLLLTANDLVTQRCLRTIYSVSNQRGLLQECMKAPTSTSCQETRSRKIVRRWMTKAGCTWGRKECSTERPTTWAS